MTVAICLKCGAFKVGAWTHCLQCDFCPDDDESCTKHLLATDHYLSSEKLQAMSERIKAGGTIDFPENLLKQMWVSKADIDKSNRGCTIGCAVVVAVVLTILGALVYWKLHRSSLDPSKRRERVEVASGARINPTPLRPAAAPRKSRGLVG